MNLAKEGRYGLAMRSLGSLGCGSSDDNKAFEELIGRHPIHNLPSLSDNIPPSLVVDSAAILAAPKAFPKGSRPGASRLHGQHLIDAISGSISLDAQLCLKNLTRLVSKYLSGNLHVDIAPWLIGAHLVALRKKSGGVHPFAVGEGLRRLVN